jgi:hypothetical protein
VFAEVTSTDEERTAARLPKHNTQDGQERELREMGQTEAMRLSPSLLKFCSRPRTPPRAASHPPCTTPLSVQPKSAHSCHWSAQRSLQELSKATSSPKAQMTIARVPTGAISVSNR